MGMFDYIICEAPIPLPEEMKDFDLEFQTKSLGSSLAVYCISKDGNLYDTGFFEETNPDKKKKIDYHGIIDFYVYHTTDLVDYCADFEAKFTDGILQGIKLTKYEKTEHESRQKKIEKIFKAQEKEYKKINKRFYRFLDKNLFQRVFSLFGLSQARLEFSYPKIIFLYSSGDRQKNYGFYFEELSTGICLKKANYATIFNCKFLGFGFSVTNFKPINF